MEQDHSYRSDHIDIILSHRVLVDSLKSLLARWREVQTTEYGFAFGVVRSAAGERGTKQPTHTVCRKYAHTLYTGKGTHIYSKKYIESVGSEDKYVSFLS